MLNVLLSCYSRFVLVCNGEFIIGQSLARFTICSHVTPLPCIVDSEPVQHFMSQSGFHIQAYVAHGLSVSLRRMYLLFSQRVEADRRIRKAASCSGRPSPAGDNLLRCQQCVSFLRLSLYLSRFLPSQSEHIALLFSLVRTHIQQHGHLRFRHPRLLWPRYSLVHRPRLPIVSMATVKVTAFNRLCCNATWEAERSCLPLLFVPYRHQSLPDHAGRRSTKESQDPCKF
jgi:hypothetical protein